MRITEIRPRRKSLSAVFLDGEFAMNLDTAALREAGWREGLEISDEELLTLKQESSRRRAREKALYLLEHRDHSKKELAEKIARTEGVEAGREAAERMEEIGLVNDASYARRYAAELLGRKGFAPRRARQELRRKGIDSELIEEILAEQEEDPQEKIREILERKYARVLPDEKGRRRAIGALERLGYEYDDIRSVLREMITDLDCEE